MRTTLSRLLPLLALLLLPPSVEAALVEVGGRAELSLWDEEGARRSALKDAVSRASELGEVASAARVLHMADHHRGSLPAEGAGYRIVSEERVDGLLYLSVELDVAAAGGCAQLSPYRKKVAVTAFPMVRPAQGRGREVNFLEQGVARELGERLRRDALYRVVELAPRHPFSGRNEESQLLSHGAVDVAEIVAIGEEFGVQAVVTGIIRDAGVRVGDHYRFDTPLGGKPITLIGDERAFELELLIYDAVSGALLANRTFREEASGEVTLDVDTPSGLSRSFLTSGYGRAVERLLRHAALAVDFSLVCRPFMTRVVRVEGDEIYLDAGTTANVAKGSLFNAVITYRDAFSAGAGVSTLVETAAGELTVVKSEPGFSIGRLKVENALRPGDIVREP